jgi:hypothetical protein
VTLLLGVCANANRGAVRAVCESESTCVTCRVRTAVPVTVYSSGAVTVVCVL